MCGLMMVRVSKVRHERRWQWVVLAALAAGVARAEPPAAAVQAPMDKVSVEQYQAQVKTLAGLVDACAADVAGCDAAKVGPDDRVDALKFQVRWTWLRQALTEARAAKPERRAELMKGAAERVAEMAQESAQPAEATDTAKLAEARKQADAILAGAEFRDVEEQSWWEQQKAKFWLRVGQALDGMAGVGSRFPWLGTLLEWLLFGGAAVGLVLFVRRSLLRQRLAVALNTQSQGLAWSREANDWAAQAEASARNGDWRDAVHSLYWATIVMLEGRRAWRHNPARTPREYVRLLKAGSAQQGALRGLTGIFERLWYGLREAGPADYERARGFYESLKDASATRAGAA